MHEGEIWDVTLASRATRLVIPALLGIQIACGGDASGPKHAATSIEANSSPTITAAAGSMALERPSVIVRDENGDPLAGVTVQFTVTGGGGSVTGSSVKTGTDGVATVGSWKLGPIAATNTVDASVSGLPAVRFTANAGDPCAVSTFHAVGSTSSGRLSLADCQAPDGSFVDFWTITVPNPGTYLFNQTATDFDSYLFLLGSGFHRIAENDDAAANTSNSTIKAIIPAGEFVLIANSLAAGETGTYAISSAPTSNPVTNCEDVFTFRGMATDQSLQTSDCTQNGFVSDDYVIFLESGESITVTMTSAAIDPYLELYQISTSLLVASNDDADATTKNAALTYTATNSGYFFVKARTTSAGATGAYSLSIQ